jgi:hypothetical protein
MFEALLAGSSDAMQSKLLNSCVRKHAWYTVDLVCFKGHIAFRLVWGEALVERSLLAFAAELHAAVDSILIEVSTDV